MKHPVRLKLTHNVLVKATNYYVTRDNHMAFILIYKAPGGPRALMVKAMKCGIVASEFELHFRYYVHFRINTHGKGINTLILLAMG